MMNDEPYQMSLLLLVEEHLFRVDNTSVANPQVLLDNPVIAKNATVVEFDER